MGLTKILNDFSSYLNSPRKAYSLALFRILFFIHLGYRLIINIHYREIIFDINSPKLSGLNFDYFLILWAVVIVLLIVGLFTKISSLINYFCVLLMAYISQKNGMGTFYDDISLSASFLMMFLPVSNVFSVDSKIFKTKTKVLQVHYFILIFVCLGLTYFASGITKINSSIWQNGLGIWMPAILPHFSWNNWFSWILDFKFLMSFLNYLVILWEVLFIVLVFHNKWKSSFVFLGICFHIGIGLLYYIPFVSLGSIVFYSLFIPDSFWSRFSQKNNLNPENTSKTFSKIKIQYGLLVFFIFLQLFVTSQYLKDYNTNKSKTWVERIPKSIFGISSKGVFLDDSFHYNRVMIAVNFEENGETIWLPWVNEKGIVSPDFLLEGAWQKVFYRYYYRQEIDTEKLKKSIHFWAKKSNININNKTFNILQRTSEYKFEHKKGIRKTLENQTWQKIGEIDF
jgi:hypothetical protein